MEEAQNLGDLLAATLPVGLRHVPFRMRDAARELGFSAALTGGVPRDLLRVSIGQLHHDEFTLQLRDFDVVVEGEHSGSVGGAGVRYAYELARRLPGRLTVNEAFHTATLITEDPVRIDVTTARREHYPSPGVLPEVDVRGVDIATDLLRRDFSVNALAMDLSDDYGGLVDVCGGVGDVRDRVVRVLHSTSFSDDPTRLLRAVRYCVRLGYDMEPTTRAQYSAGVDNAVLDHVSPERIRYEVECIGGEDRWAQVWAVLDLARVTGALTRPLAGISAYWDEADAEALDIAIRNQHRLLEQENIEPWLLRTAWVLHSAASGDLEPSCARLGLHPRQRAWVVAAREIVDLHVPQLMEMLSPSEICRRLEAYPRPAVAIALLTYQPRTQDEVTARKALKHYLEEYSAVRSELSGNDLLSLGLKPGPLVGELRDELRYLRLDGAINDIEAEREYAREWIDRRAQAGNGHPADEVPGVEVPRDGEEEREQ